MIDMYIPCKAVTPSVSSNYCGSKGGIEVSSVEGDKVCVRRSGWAVGLNVWDTHPLFVSTVYVSTVSPFKFLTQVSEIANKTKVAEVPEEA